MDGKKKSWICDKCVYRKYDGMGEDTCYCRMQQGGGKDGKLVFKRDECAMYARGMK